MQRKYRICGRKRILYETIRKTSPVILTGLKEAIKREKNTDLARCHRVQENSRKVKEDRSGNAGR